MKKATLALCAMIAVTLVLAVAHPASAVGKTHDLKGTIESVDLKEKKITFKDESGTSMTAPVLGNAVASLKSVKAGQAVTITCQDNENGDHEGVSAIKVEKVAKASKKK